MDTTPKKHQGVKKRPLTKPKVDNLQTDFLLEQNSMFVPFLQLLITSCFSRQEK